MKIKKSAINCIKCLVRTVASPFDSHRLNVMSQSDTPEISSLSQVLKQSFAKKSDTSGLENIQKIEKHREQLLSCQEPLVNGKFGESMPGEQNITVSRACRASKGPYRALPLYFLIRQFSPMSCLELGTNLGISAAYQAAALIANQKNGKIITMEGSKYRLKIARDLHQQLGFDNISYVQGIFNDTLPETLKNNPPIDYAFIDGHHQYEPTINYFNLIYQHCTDNCIFIFDDIRLSAGMRRAWRELRSDTRFSIVLDMFTFGICIASKSESQSAPKVVGPFFKLF